jgi:hypothetical protein
MHGDYALQQLTATFQPVASRHLFSAFGAAFD